MTCTIVGWLPVFTRPDAVNLIYNSWRFLKEGSQFRLYAYVILENHLHFIASSPDLPTDMQRFKSFTARTIVDLPEQRKAASCCVNCERISSDTRRAATTSLARRK